jgi:sec-independent protein translocase protein TatC
VLSLVLWIGISFEMPLLFMFLGRLGIVSPRLLLRGWRIAVVAIAVIAAAITPTVDPFNMMLVMGPLIALYFLSIILTAIVYRKRQANP